MNVCRIVIHGRQHTIAFLLIIFLAHSFQVGTLPWLNSVNYEDCNGSNYYKAYHKALHGINRRDEGSSEPEFESLDVMLEKARKRGVNPIFRLQAFLNSPVLPESSRLVLTNGDIAFAAVATALGATGFAVGLLVGRWTSVLFPVQVRNSLPPLLVQLYPVFLAIICDQILF